MMYKRLTKYRLENDEIKSNSSKVWT